MTAPIDTQFGAKNDYFEDFKVTAIGDLPEVDVQSATGVTTAILADQLGGVVEIPVAATDDDDVAAVSTNLNYQIEAGGLYGEARVKVDTSIADMKFFIGFADNIASADETTFSATTDTVTIDTVSDGIGWLFDNDATTKNFWAVAGAADAVTVGVSVANRHDFSGVGVWKTFGVYASPDGKAAEWYIDGEKVYSTESASALVTVTDPLCFGVWNYEQGTAYELEVDYLYVRNGRDQADN